MGIERVAAISNIGIIAALTFCWFLELFVSNGWHMKSSVLYNAEVSLWGMEVSHGAFVGGANYMMKGLSRDSQTLLEKIAVGKYSWQQTTQYMCQLSKSMAVGFMGMNGCQIWRNMRSMSIMLGLLIFTGMILFSFGAAFSYQYWFKKPSKKTRLWTRGFLIGAPTCFGIGLTFYYFLTKRLAEFPPQAGSTLGHSFVFAVFLLVLSLTPILIHETFAHKDREEELLESKRSAGELSMQMPSSSMTEPSSFSYQQGPALTVDHGAEPPQGMSPGAASSVSCGSVVVANPPDKE